VIRLAERISAPMRGFVQPDQRRKESLDHAATPLRRPDRFSHLVHSPYSLAGADAGCSTVSANGPG